MLASNEAPNTRGVGKGSMFQVDCWREVETERGTSEARRLPTFYVVAEDEVRAEVDAMRILGNADGFVDYDRAILLYSLRLQRVEIGAAA